MAIDPNDIYGGPQLYNPALGLTIQQNPELVIQHLASRGVPVPPDIPEGADHVDAGHSLGRALAFNIQNESPLIGGNIIPGASSPTMSYIAPEGPLTSTNAPEPFAPPANAAPGLPGSNPTFDERFNADVEHPARVHPIPKTPTPPQPPTPAPEAASNPGGGEPPPQSASQELPGQDGNVPVPTPDPRRDANASQQTSHSPLDTLGAALAGLHAPGYQNPLHIYSPQAPRPSNMIARSTVPQTLMAEIAGISHPTSTFRLGEALRGKAYA